MKRFGRFQILGELGSGGMGTVFRVRDPLGQERALKLPDPSLRFESDLLERFVREARLGYDLRHPGLAAVHEAGQLEGRPYLVMDLVEGRPLDRVLQDEGALAPRRAAGIVARLCDAVAALHEARVLHRDLKPANVILGPEGPVLTDLGLAKLRDGLGPSLTETGMVLGTPGFMAPEQAVGDREIGVACDVYGLGATLYALLTARAPFPGRAPLQVLRAVVEDPLEPPSRVRAGIPPSLEAICLRCLEKDPAARFPSAAALRRALEDYLGSGGVALPRRRSHTWLVPALGVVLAAGASAAWWSRLSRAPIEARPSSAPSALDMARAGWEELEGARYEQAAEAFDRALADDGDCVPALVGKGWLALERASPGDRAVALRVSRQEARAALDLAPTDPDANVLLAWTDERLGRTEEALERLNEVLAQAPSHVPALRRRALVSAERDVAGALADLRQAYAVRPDDWQTRVLLAGALGFLAEEEQVARLLDSLEADRPGDPQVLALRGEQARRRGDLERSLELHERARAALSAQPATPGILAEILALRGWACAEAKRYGDARAALKEGLELYPGHNLALRLLAQVELGAGHRDEALAIFTRITENSPRDSDAWFWRGRLLAREGRLEPALRAAERAADLAPHDLKVLWLLTGVLELNGRLAEMLTPLGRLVDLSPDPDYRFKRGAVLATLGRVEEGEADMSRAIARDDQRLDWFADRAMARYSLGRGEGAAADLRRALGLRSQSSDPKLFDRMARLADELGELALTAAFLERLLELTPEDTGRLYAYAERQLSLGNEAAAEGALARMLELDPRDEQALGTLAYVCAVRGDVAAARDYVAQVRANGGHPVNLRALEALITVRAGQPQEALEQSARVLGEAPEISLMHYVQGEALRQLGRTAAARDAYQRFLGVDPTHALTGEVQRTLEELGAD